MSRIYLHQTPLAIKGVWGEPFVVSTDDSDRICEYETDDKKQTCEETSRWFIEVVGYLGQGEVPHNPPVIYTCDKHVTSAMDTLR